MVSTVENTVVEEDTDDNITEEVTEMSNDDLEEDYVDGDEATSGTDIVESDVSSGEATDSDEGEEDSDSVSGKAYLAIFAGLVIVIVGILSLAVIKKKHKKGKA